MFSGGRLGVRSARQGLGKRLTPRKGRSIRSLVFPSHVSSLSRLVLAVCGGDPMTKRWLPLLAWLAAVGLPSVAAAQPVGPEFQVNTYTTENQWYPAVSSDAIGNFVVVWAGAGQGDSRGIFGQRYDNSGNSLGAEFSVSVGFFSYYQQ